MQARKRKILKNGKTSKMKCKQIVNLYKIVDILTRILG